MKRPAKWAHVKDVDGALWDVRDARSTKHGFDLLFGFPVGNRLHHYQGGPPRVIATRELQQFWEKNRTSEEGIMFDLPAGRTTLKRVRKRLGFNQVKDRRSFWRARLRDLQKLSPRDFARKHNVKREAARDWRYRLLGAIARPIGWWRKPSVLKLLRSELSLRQVGEKLGISISQVHRLRQRARA